MHISIKLIQKYTILKNAVSLLYFREFSKAKIQPTFWLDLIILNVWKERAFILKNRAASKNSIRVMLYYYTESKNPVKT